MIEKSENKHQKHLVVYGISISLCVLLIMIGVSASFANYYAYANPHDFPVIGSKSTSHKDHTTAKAEGLPLGNKVRID